MAVQLSADFSSDVDEDVSQSLPDFCPSESMAHLYDTSIFIDCRKCCSYDSLTVFGKRSLEFIGESKGARNVLDI